GADRGSTIPAGVPTVTTALHLTITERAPATARRLAAAAVEFLASRNESQRKAATLPFGDDRRYVWDYRPPESTPRNGLRLINMKPQERRQGHTQPHNRL